MSVDSKEPLFMPGGGKSFFVCFVLPIAIFVILLLSLVVSMTDPTMRGIAHSYFSTVCKPFGC